ncbi:MAG: hypothetical protein K6B15_07740 [Parasporobacterium sp.]|nr:hypothetical protein [Parasporobacterium sp.]
MPDRKSIKNKILNRSDLSKEVVDCVLSSKGLTREEVQKYIHRYVCYKFLLEPEENEGLSMTKLADKSIEKALELKIPIAKEGEKATTCGAAGSSAMKIALLLNAIRKDFDVDIEAHKLGFAKNTNEIGSLVFDALSNKKGA